MKTATVLIKTDPELLKRSKAAVAAMGISFNLAVNNFMRELSEKKEITIRAHPTPNARTRAILKKSENPNKKDLSPTFSNGTDAVKWLFAD